MARKDGRNTFWKKLNTPPNWIAVLAYISVLVIFPLAAVAAIFGHGDNVYTVIAVAICSIPVLYVVLVVIVFGKRLYKRFSRVKDKLRVAKNLYKSYEVKSVFLTICSLVGNVGYTVFLCVMAIQTDFAWYGALAAYYILLVTARGGILLQNARDERKYMNDELLLRKSKTGTYRYCGVMMIALSLALAFSVVQLILSGAEFRSPEWALIAIAAVTLYRIVMMVYHFVKSSKKKDMVVRSYHYINVGAVFVSVLSLQTAMFAAYDPSFDPTYVTAATGGVCCLIILALGIYMVRHSFTVKRRIMAQAETELGTDASELAYNREGYAQEYGWEAVGGNDSALVESSATEVFEDSENTGQKG